MLCASLPGIELIWRAYGFLLLAWKSCARFVFQAIVKKAELINLILQMNKRTLKIFGALVVGAGAIGTAGTFLKKRSKRLKDGCSGEVPVTVWARPGMSVTFRAELKPGRDAADRTFKVATLLSNRRVLLVGMSGEHTESEFERTRFD